MIDKIKIGIKEYTVSYDDNILTSGKVGEIDYNYRTIKIFPQKHKDDNFIILLHEIMHGIFEDSGHTGEESYGADESLIDFIALKILQIFRDNPGLIKYLK